MTSRSFRGWARALNLARARQTWTIAKIELRRAFFAKRSFWVYGLALMPSVIFFGHGLDAKFRSERLARRSLITPALIDSIREGESADEVKKRLGKPAQESWSTRSRRVRQRTGNAGTTTHVIEPAGNAFRVLECTRVNAHGPDYKRRKCFPTREAAQAFIAGRAA